MKANPGGLVSPKNVIGRDRFIERLWSTLEQLGVVLVVESSPLDLGELHDRLKVSFQPDNEVSRGIVEGDREMLRTLVKLMQRDHYLRQEEDGAYAFRFDLIRRWWRLDLGLS